MRRALAIAAVAALASTALACDGRPKTSAATSSERGDRERQPKSGPAVAVVDLTDGLPEIEATGFLGVPVHTATFDRFVRAVPAIAKDKDVKGVLVRFGSTTFGLARATEVGEKLATLKDAGTPVYCHADVFTNATMMAAARGCSKIWISPAGTVEATGLALQVLYFHKLLADELHLSVDFLQIGKYKGAEEPFTRDGPSDEARSTMQSMIGDVRNAWIDEVKKGRGRDDAVAAVEDGPWGPEAAKAHGLVDEIGFHDDALDAVKKAASAVRDEVRFGHGAADKDEDELGDLVRLLAGTGGSHAPVALVRATGAISMAPGGGLLGERSGITETEMAKVLARVEHDDSIKALVLRIDSPGGSALASDLIWHHLRKIHDAKPIVVSVGGMAASGGYYIASAANQIFAEPTSIVGSIGVVSGKVAAGDALGKIGVHAETFAGSPDPKAKARADYGSIVSPWDDATKQRMVDSAKSIYELFLQRVADGRGTTPDKVAPYAEGRLFSGLQAKANGLVDELGGLEAAIARARALAKLPDDAAVSTFAPRAGLLDALTGGDGDGDESRGPASRAIAPPSVAAGAMDVVERAAPELVPFVTSLDAMASGERSLVAVPYAVLLR